MVAQIKDFPYVTCYCTHCHALNRSKQAEEHVSRSNSPRLCGANEVNNIPGLVNDDTLTSSSSNLAITVSDFRKEVVEKDAPENPVKEEED